MAINKKKSKGKDKPGTTEQPTPAGPAAGETPAGAGRPPRELSREELEQLRERLQKKFH